MCLIDGCEDDQRNGGIMCAAHWNLVPPDLRDEINMAAARWHNAHTEYETYDQAVQARDCNCTQGLPHTGEVGEFTTAACPQHDRRVATRITALAQRELDAYDAWAELRDTAVGEVELQEAEAG